MSRRFTLVFSLGWFVFTLLACSIGGPDAAPTAAPTMAPATTAPPVEPTVPPPTKVQVEVPTAIPTVAGEVLPTDTATPSLTPTPSSTPTPTSTSTKRPVASTAKPPAVTVTKKSGTVEPLTVHYDIVGIKRNPGDQAVLTLKVIATGGGGGYAYYNDDQKQAGAIFDVAGRCGKPFNHTLKVTSASGQVYTESYFIGGLCPSPTPTP